MKTFFVSSPFFLLLSVVLRLAYQWVLENFYRGNQVPQWFGFIDLAMVYLPWLLAIPALIISYVQMSKKEWFAVNFICLLIWGFVLGDPLTALIQKLYLQYFV